MIYICPQVLMIVNISPNAKDLEETVNVLKFSAIAQEVTTKPSDVGKTPCTRLRHVLLVLLFATANTPCLQSLLLCT
jgi:hypothetical protein